MGRETQRKGKAQREKEITAMTLTFLHFALLLFGVLLACYLLAGLRARELAIAAAQRHCQQQSLQLLDQSVSLHRVWPARDAIGQWRMRRTYHFEFTATGGERYRGQLTSCGHSLEKIQLQPHRFPDQCPPQ